MSAQSSWSSRAMVTGDSRGLGRATALGLARTGAELVIATGKLAR